MLVKKEPRDKRCYKCASVMRRVVNRPDWESKKAIDKDGYIRIRLLPNDFFYPTARKNGWILEHRLVMAKYLGRNLHSWEIVHHKGIRYLGIENRQDNLEDNLALSSSLGEHIADHSKGYKDGYQKGLLDGRTKQVEELKQEIRLLQWHVKQMQGIENKL